MWIVYALLASVLWGVDYTLTERVLGKMGFSTLLALELFFGFFAMLGVALISGKYKADLAALFSSKQTFIFVVLIIVIFNVANGFIVLSIGAKNATLSGLIEISYPVFIALFSWLFFSESTLNIGTGLGGALICTGVVLIYYFNR